MAAVSTAQKVIAVLEEICTRGLQQPHRVEGWAQLRRRRVVTKKFELLCNVACWSTACALTKEK